MFLVGLTIARNEGWCLAASATAAMRWCDAMVILNHSSTDETPGIIRKLAGEYPGRIHELKEHDPVWREMNHRQQTLDKARQIGATHCAIIDADEFLAANLIPTIRSHIEALSPGQVMQPPWLTLWRSLGQYRDDQSVWSRSFVSMAFADAPQLCWHVRDEGYDHHRRHPFGSVEIQPWQDKALGGLMHCQHANWRRVLAKQAWYRCVEMIRWPQFGAAVIEAKYAPTTDESGIGLSAVPDSWWGPERNMIDMDREPWQESAVREMVAEHGREKFSGLNLLGVA